MGSGLSGSPGTVTLKAGHVGIQGDVQEVCLPKGFQVFSDGSGYFHGGLSLQEAIVPIVMFKAGQEKQTAPGKPAIEILYRSDRFTSRELLALFGCSLWERCFDCLKNFLTPVFFG